jgi:hypothetical protein
MAAPVAASPGDADGDGRTSVADSVLTLRAAAGLASPCTIAACDVDGSGVVTVTDGVEIARVATGLPAPATPAVAPRGPAPTLVPVHFTFDATAALQGYQVEVTYPLAKGGFAGSADGVACTANGDVIFVANDRDDGTLVLLEADVSPLAFPRDVRCTFAQAPGETLASGDLAVTVVEVVEANAPGDPADLLAQITIGDADVPVCSLGGLRMTTNAGGLVDLGWTGLAHDTPYPAESSAVVPLDCSGGTSTCALASTNVDFAPAGAPFGISTGGVPMCVITEFRSPLTGTFDCDTGCMDADVHLLARVFLVPFTDSPCPPCIGDPVPNDGARGGTCAAGALAGLPCDAQGLNPRFESAGTDFGTTSRDCPPDGSSVGELELDIDPVTTGTTTRTATVDCLSGASPAGSCFCPGQVQASSCIPDGVCPASGVCEEGPLDGVCSLQRFRYCIPDSGTQDCDDVFPGAGTCVTEPRPCFGTTIERTGGCGLDDGELAGIMCVPATRAAAINTVVGLPGPAAFELPVRFAAAPALSPVPTFEPTPQASPTPPAPVGCAGFPRSDCHQLVRPHEASLTIRDKAGTDELAWRWLGGTATSGFELGDPTFQTSYALCAYGDAGLLFQSQAGPTDVCRRSQSCWRPTNRGGFAYANHFGNADGVTRIELTPGLEGGARVAFKARGKSITLPGLPLPTPLTVQLQASDASCWEAIYDAGDVLKNEPTTFRAVTKP